MASFSTVLLPTQQAENLDINVSSVICALDLALEMHQILVFQKLIQNKGYYLDLPDYE